jgi:hypothetical protein
MTRRKLEPHEAQMRVIYKYAIPAADSFQIDLPQSAKILTVQVQCDGVKIWAVVNPEEPKRTRHFQLVPTGVPFFDGATTVYVGTFQLQDGALVFHLFEDIE